MTMRLEGGTRADPVARRFDHPNARFICAECRYAQLFAVQPRALCTCASSDLDGRVLFAGQPACSHLIPRKSSGPLMAWCSPGTKQMSHRFPRGRH